MNGQGMQVVDRAAAVIAVLAATVCAVLHVLILLEERSVAASLMLMIAILCLGCAMHGLRNGLGIDMWAWMAVGSLLMLIVHLLWHRGAGHSHSNMNMAANLASGEGSKLLYAALIVTLVELATALFALAFAGVVARKKASQHVAKLFSEIP